MTLPRNSRGDSCQACATAKQRCQPGPSPPSANNNNSNLKGQCLRCHRLHKECLPQKSAVATAAATAARKANKREDRTTRLSRLEEKLDTLLLVSNSTSSTSTSTSTSAAAAAHREGEVAEQYQQQSLERGSNSEGFGAAGGDAGQTELHASGTPQSGEFGQVACPMSPVVNDVADETATLVSFQARQAAYFPFVVISPSSSPSLLAELHQTKPFLSLAIRLAMSRDPSEQLLLGAELREDLARRMIVRGERSLDLVQGLLVAIECYHLHLMVNLQLVNFLQLLSALLVDLGLSRSPLTLNDRQRLPVDGLSALPRSGGGGCGILINTSRSLDERRAYLGYFYLNSLTSICLKKLEPLAFTAYVRECCITLREARAELSDEMLIHLVELQQIAAQIRHTFTHDNAEPNNEALSSATVNFCIPSFQKQLKSLKESLPQSIAQSPWYLLHYHIIDIFLCEIGFELRSDRVGILTSCLQSTKAFFDLFFSIPATEYSHFNYVFFMFFMHAIVILCKLSLLEDAAWDAAHVRSVVDLSVVIDMASLKVFQYSQAEGHHLTEDGTRVRSVFSRFAGQLKRLKLEFERRLNFDDTAGAAAAAAETTVLTGKNMDVPMTEPLDFSAFAPVDGEFVNFDGLFDSMDFSFWQNSTFEALV